MLKFNKMKVYQFLALLQQHKEKSLLFAYEKNLLVAPNYHITEIKNVDFKTVDCGGKQNKWQETQLQLWEKSSEKDKIEYLTTTKALSIFNLVNSINPLWLQTEIKIEYGNNTFHTAILKITDFNVSEDSLLFNLFKEKTQCKANTETNKVCC